MVPIRRVAYSQRRPSIGSLKIRRILSGPNEGVTVTYNLDGRIFRSVTNTPNGEAGPGTLFYYRQRGDVVSAEYSSETIVSGHLLARVLENGELEMRYHHLNNKGEFMVGKCVSTPEVLPDGRLKFKESWQWLSGDRSAGYSEIEELKHLDCGGADVS
jgi:hypothetical protein